MKQASKSAGASEKAASKLADEVSLDKQLNSLEGAFVFHSFPRRLFSGKNSSRHFVQNPLLNFPDCFDSL